jgi:hypothetical protein
VGVDLHRPQSRQIRQAYLSIAAIEKRLDINDIVVAWQLAGRDRKSA